jgi:hypothetical protein
VLCLIVPKVRVERKAADFADCPLASGSAGRPRKTIRQRADGDHHLADRSLASVVNPRSTPN